MKRSLAVSVAVCDLIRPMRRPWIKIETATPDKPEICAIATTLRMDSDAVLGKLVRLWSWVEVNRVSANDLGVTKEFLDRLVGRKGFASALIACGWLTELDGRLGLPNLGRHNGGSAKVRALTAQRVALHRQRKQVASLSSVSSPLHSRPRVAESLIESNDALNVSTIDDTFEISSETANVEVASPMAEAVTSIEEVCVVHSPETFPPEELGEDEFLAGDMPDFEEADRSSESVPEPHAPEAMEPAEPAESPAEDSPARKRRGRTNVEPDPDQPMLF